MKLNAFTDYSLRVLVYLATRPERRVTIAEISEAFGINANHLTKVVNHLGRNGWVETVRGKGGGIRLGRPPGEIVVGAVVRDAEGAAEPAECFATERSDCPIVACCHLKKALADAVKAFYAELDRHTLADITRNRTALSIALQRHRPAAGSAP